MHTIITSYSCAMNALQDSWPLGVINADKNECNVVKVRSHTTLTNSDYSVTSHQYEITVLQAISTRLQCYKPSVWDYSVTSHQYEITVLQADYSVTSHQYEI